MSGAAPAAHSLCVGRKNLWMAVRCNILAPDFKKRKQKGNKKENKKETKRKQKRKQKEKKETTKGRLGTKICDVLVLTKSNYQNR
jgi:hypothetical protein